MDHNSPELVCAVGAVLNKSISRNGQPDLNDHDDFDHRNLLDLFAQAHGMTPERYPALFTNLRGQILAPAVPTTPAAGDFNDGQVINYVAPLTANNFAAAHGTLTRLKEIKVTYLTISVLNAPPGGAAPTVVASNSVYTFNQQTSEVRTNDLTASQLPTTGTNYGLLAWDVTYTDNTRETSNRSGVWTAYNTLKDPSITAPVINPARTKGDLTSVMVGLSRGFNNPGLNVDLDYWFWQNDWATTQLLVPLVGTMYFKYPIAAIGPANPQVLFCLSKVEGGMSIQQTTPPVGTVFQIDPNNPNNLIFTFQPTTTAAGTAINFGVSPWDADTQTFFSAKITVTFANPNFGQGWSSIVSSLAPDTNPTDGVLYIKPLRYVWHCIVAGTLITMADGTTKAIETIVSGDIVKGPAGSLTVQATLAAPHWGPVLAIATGGNRTITCSGSHPIITPTGPVRADALTIGATIVVASGPNTVVSITTLQQTGQGLFNLWLAAPVNEAVYYANGVAVGDYQMQIAAVVTPQQVRARLPQELWTDFDNYQIDHPTP